MKTQIDLNDTEVAFRYKSNPELYNSIFIFGLLQKPFLVKILTKMAGWVLQYKLPFKFAISKTVFKVFCAGQNRNEAAQTIQKLKNYKVNTVLDYVAEGDSTKESFDNNMKTILANISFMKENSSKALIGIKLSGLEDVAFIKRFRYIEEADDTHSKERMNTFIGRVDTICNQAAEKNVFVYIDAEEYSTQDIFDQVVELMMLRYNKGRIIVFNTLQMYLKDRMAYLEYAIADARQKGFMIGMKLVRGAYVEKERVYAAQSGVESPVFDTKEETDRSYDKAVEICLQNSDIVYTCLATHNQESVALALSLIGELNITDHAEKVSFSQLFGMSDHLTFNLAQHNFNASKYVPYGEVEKAIPYLLRRAEENSSIEGQAGRAYELLMQEKRRRSRKKEISRPADATIF